MITKIVECDDYVVITEDGKDYVCDNNPGVIGGEILIAEFHPRGNHRKTLLTECFDDEETCTRTYKPFTSELDEKRAWEIYADILDCM